MILINNIKNLFLSEKIIFGVIVLNTICLFLQGFHNLEHIAINIAYHIDHIITFVFLFEMIIKIRHFNWINYIKSGWNRLDFILVMLSIPSMIDYIFDISFIDTTILLIFRLLRVFRFLRLIKYIPGIDGLIQGSIRALKTSIMVIVVFGVTLSIISLFTNYIFNEVSPEHFGNPLEAFYSVFKIFTVEGWFEIPDSVADNYGGIAKLGIRLFFIGILFIGGIIGLSLLNSIFVDAMVSDNNDALEANVTVLQKEIKELKQLLIENLRKE